jgi:hypothetical protein
MNSLFTKLKLIFSTNKNLTQTEKYANNFRTSIWTIGTLLVSMTSTPFALLLLLLFLNFVFAYYTFSKYGE